MTKKDTKVDETNLDSDLDFDNFDMGFEELADDREPTSKPVKSYVKGVSKGLTDTDHIKTIIRKNLPKEYGETFDMLDTMSRGTRDFAETVVKESKPIIGDLAEAADKFLPANLKSIKEKLGKISTWARADENKSQGPSKEQLRDNTIGIELGRIFENQQEQEVVKEKINRRERALDRSISMTQHKDILDTLSKISNSTGQISGYTTSINSAWQRKSLETQYRTLFILQDILEENKKAYGDMIGNLKAITKNSALPEYKKTERDEAFWQEARSRFSSRIIDASTNFFNKGVKRMREDVSRTASDIASMTSMLTMAADMHAMSQEFEPKTLTDTLAEGAGSYTGKWLTSKLGGKLFEQIKKNPELVNTIVQGQNFLGGLLDNKEGLFKNYISKKKEEGGAFSGLFGWLDDLFEFEKPDYRLKKYDPQEMYKAAPFTNKIAYSITDVIPGYLARILQEQTMLRTGRKVDLIKFDYTKGNFSKTSDIVREIKKSVSEEQLSKNADYYFKDIFATIEEHVDLTDKERSDIAQALLRKSSKGESLMPSQVTSADHWSDYTEDYQSAEKLAQAMLGIYGTADDKDFYLKLDQDPQKKAIANKFARDFKDIKGLRKNLTGVAQQLIDSGLLKEAIEGGILDKRGEMNIDLIDRNTTQLKGPYKGKGNTLADVVAAYRNKEGDLNGYKNTVLDKAISGIKNLASGKRVDKDGYIIDKDGVRVLDEKGDPIKGGTSDVNVKTDIKEPKGSILSQLKRLPIFNWRYQKGYGDNGENVNMGPMAQDLQKNFGDKVAPGGTTVDLVNANGISMKAIQELDNKVDSFKSSVKDFFGLDKKSKDKSDSEAAKSYLPKTGLECLRGIYYNTTKLTEQNSAMINISAEGLKNMAIGLGTQLGKINLDGATQATIKAYEDAVKFVKEGKATSWLGRLGDLISDVGGSAFTSGLKRGKEFIKSAWDFGNKTRKYISDKAGKISDAIKLNALETFNVFVGEEREPRMISIKIKNGSYIDADTGEPIRTRKDIRDIKTSIYEVDDSGKMSTVLLFSELPDTYFVNVYKNVVERAIINTGNFLFKTAKATIDSYIKPGFRGIKNVASMVGNAAASLIDQPIDIYIKGKPEEPVLLAKKMREGDYLDFQDGSLISRPSQIKGAVYDQGKEEVALTVEEFKQGLVDIHGKAISTNILGRTAHIAIGVGASVLGYTIDKLAKAPGMLGRLANKGKNFLSSLNLKFPGISLGFFGQESVDTLKEIRDILLYQNGLGGVPTGAGSKAANTVVGLASSIKSPKLKTVADLVGGFKSGGANDVNINKPQEGQAANDDNKPRGTGGLFKTLGGVSSAASLITRLFKRKGKAKETDTDVPEHEQEPANDRKMTTESFFKGLSERLGIKGKEAAKEDKKVTQVDTAGRQYVDGMRKGSWQEREANAVNVNKAKETEKAQVRKFAIKSIFSMIGDTIGSVKKKLSSWLGRGGDPEETAKDIATGDLPERRKRRGSSRGRFGIGRAIGAAGTAYGAYNTYEAMKEGRYGDAAISGGLTALGAGYTLGGLRGASKPITGAVGGAKSLAGKVLGGSVGAAAKRLGLAGAAYGAYSAYQDYNEGNYGSAAMNAGLAAATGIASVGGISAAGALLVNPVFWGVAAAGLAAYGGYKAYKYLTRKEFNYTEKMRMSEYGLRGGDDGLMRKIYELEEYIESVSKMTDSELVINKDKLDFSNILSIFEIGTNDQKQRDSFTAWFNERFRPIFTKWKALVKTVGDSDKISWLEKAPNDKLFEIYKAFRLTPDVYSIKASPFKNIAINTDVTIISRVRDIWLSSLKDVAVKTKDNETRAQITETGKAIVEARRQGQSDNETLDRLQGKTVQLNNIQVPGEQNRVKLALKVSSTIDNDLIGIYQNKTITALMAVKLKSYGLKELKSQKLTAFNALEYIVNDNIKIDTSGKANFDGDINDIIKRVGGVFGFTQYDEFAKEWLLWFQDRFLPVYLNYHTCLFNISKRVDIKTNLLLAERLKASDNLFIAKILAATTGIWNVTQFAFKGEESNLDPKSVEDNIAFLERASKDEKLNEEKASKTTNQTPVNTQIQKKLDDITKVSSAPQTSFAQTSSKKLNITAGIDEVEDKSYADKQGGGSSASTISNRSVGSLVNAPGDLVSGSGAEQYLKLDGKVNINGLHPSVKKLFLGMVQEYGELTGKSIQVNRAYSSPQEQATLYKQYGPGRAARPGTSLHEFGLALDVQSSDLEQLDKLGLLRKYGFTRPLGSEPWHLEPAGIYDAKVRERAKKDQEFATSYIEQGIGKGGGGLGSRGRKGELIRDDKYAKMVFDAASRTLEDKQPSDTAVALSQDMTKAASQGSNTAFAKATIDPSGISEVESNNGKIPSSVGYSPQKIASIARDAKAANDDLNNTNYDITSQVKGTIRSYNDLPDSTGTGWAGNGLLIKEAAKVVGVDPGLGAAVAAKESSLNPNALGKNSAAGNNRAEGLFQFMPGTWRDMLRRHGKKYGIPDNTPATNAKANALLGLEYLKEGLAKGDGSAHEGYLGLFLGHGGLNSFKRMKMEDIPAKVMTSFAANNPNVFFHGGNKTKPRTKAQMIDFVNQSLNKQLTEFNIPLTIGNMKQQTTEPAAAPEETFGLDVSKLAQSGQEPARQQVAYSRPLARAQQPEPLQTFSDNAPVSTRRVVAPVVENKDNGIAKLVTSSADLITETKRTNELLGEIKDILIQSIIEARNKKQSVIPDQTTKPTEEPPKRTTMNKQPTELPPSFINRKWG